MNAALLLSSVCLVAGGLLFAYAHVFRRPALAVRLARAEGLSAGRVADRRLGFEMPAWLSGLRASYERDLRQAGGRKTLARFLAHKALVAVALPLVALLPYGAASGRLPPAGVLLLLAIAGFFVPDLMLRSEVKRRREAIFLDLPEAIAVLALALGAGQSLRQALELAARDCPGALGEELTRALSLAPLGGSGAGLSARKPRRQDCDESRRQGGQAPVSSQQRAPDRRRRATQTDHSQGTPRSGQSLDESRAARRHQAGDGPRQTDPPSLTVS